MNSIIKIENLSKIYRLGVVGTGTLSHDLRRWYFRIRGLEDPYLKLGEESRSNTRGKSEYVWALKDINLNVETGNVLGIIGKNGAGKSTLLKILSKVTGPTTGAIHYNGRIGSLLEIGTGFHPELTGRENIFLNGAILGMTKAEIRGKLDEIIDFSGIGIYIDTPVKRYSSGMMVRLGFAVAAHLEPEILIVDEVLAVGDAEFQRKAIGKMHDVSHNEGRTVLFVSHNMSAVKSLCNTVTVLNNGMIDRIGTADAMINHYLSTSTGNSGDPEQWSGDEFCQLNSARIINSEQNGLEYITREDTIGIEFTFTVKKEVDAVANINLYTGDGTHVFFSSEKQAKKPYRPGTYRSVMWIPMHFLNSGLYFANLYFTSLLPYKIHFTQEEALRFEVVEDTHSREINYVGVIPGVIRPILNWETQKL
jgi:lipopolysaccharide transport system ATP-binding protein